VHDNPALAGAAREADRVVPLFVLEERLLAGSARRARLLAAALHDLDRSLRCLGAALVVRRGDVAAETIRVVRESNAQAVFVAEDVSAYAHRREQRLSEQVEVRSFPGMTVVPPGVVTPSGRECYRVFTPCHRAWAATPWRAPEHRPAKLTIADGVEVGDLPTSTSEGGETAARAGLERWLAEGDSRYPGLRDDLASRATSRQLNGFDDSPSCRSFDPSRPLMWYRHGRWKRTVVTIDEVVHNFPAPHTEFLT